jgi:hypothetical protein
MNSHTHRSPGQELHHLEQVAEEGESGETPFIVGGAAFALISVVFLVVLGLALLGYYLG